MMQKTIHILIIISLAMIFQACEKENLSPSCSIIQPAAGTEFENNTSIEIEVQASDPDGEVEMVKLWFDNVMITTMNNPPYKYKFSLTGKLPGSHTIKAKSFDAEGLTASDQIQIFLIEAENLPDTSDTSEPSKTIITINLNDRYYDARETDLMPTCDGYLDEVEEPWYMDYAGWTAIRNPVSDSDENFNSRFCMLHNNKHLFIAIVADDSGDFNSNNPLERDRIEIFLSMEDDPLEDGHYTDGCWAISVNVDEDENLIHNHFTGYYGGDTTHFNRLLNADEFYWGIERYEDSYVVEMSLPYEVLVGESDFNGERILFDIAVTDYDENEFIDKKYWHSASGKQGYDTRELGRVDVLYDRVE